MSKLLDGFVNGHLHCMNFLFNLNLRFEHESGEDTKVPDSCNFKILSFVHEL